MERERKYISALTFDQTVYQIWCKYQGNNEWFRLENPFSNDEESTITYTGLLRKQQEATSSPNQLKIFVTHSSSREVGV